MRFAKIKLNFHLHADLPKRLFTEGNTKSLFSQNSKINLVILFVLNCMKFYFPSKELPSK